jgi:hypothetical protein
MTAAHRWPMTPAVMRRRTPAHPIVAPTEQRRLPTGRTLPPLVPTHGRALRVTGTPIPRVSRLLQIICLPSLALLTPLYPQRSHPFTRGQTVGRRPALGLPPPLPSPPNLRCLTLAALRMPTPQQYSSSRRSRPLSRQSSSTPWSCWRAPVSTCWRSLLPRLNSRQSLRVSQPAPTRVAQRSDSQSSSSKLALGHHRFPPTSGLRGHSFSSTSLAPRWSWTTSRRRSSQSHT